MQPKRPGPVKIVRHWHPKTNVLRCAATCQMIHSKEGYSLAYERLAPAKGCESLPALLFCNGLLSDRSGKKACLLKQLGMELGCEVVLYDARAHGETPGTLAELGVDDWLADAQLILDKVVTFNKVVVIGSSLGAWVASLLAVSRPARVAALLLIAPAIDISEHHWTNGLVAEDKNLGWATRLFPLQSPYVSTVPPATTQQTVSLLSTTAAGATEGTTQTTNPTTCYIRGEGSVMEVLDQQQDVANTKTVLRQEPGPVMLGLQFFVQGSHLLFIHDRSQFLIDLKQQYGKISMVSSATSDNEPGNNPRNAHQCRANRNDQSSTRCVPDLVEQRLKLLSNIPISIVHGTADVCVPIGISLQLMQALDGGSVDANQADASSFQNWLSGTSSSSFDIQDTTLERDDVGMNDDSPTVQSLHVITRHANHCHRLYAVEGGDHRLSKPTELQLLCDLVTQLVKGVNG